MSHLTRIMTELTDMECLEKALKDMGYAIEKGGVMSNHGDTEQVDFKAGGMGFKKTKTGKIQVVESWGSRTNLGKLKQRYAFHKTIKEVSKNRKYSVRHNTLKDGTINVDLDIL